MEQNGARNKSVIMIIIIIIIMIIIIIIKIFLTKSWYRLPNLDISRFVCIKNLLVAFLWEGLTQQKFNSENTMNNKVLGQAVLLQYCLVFPLKHYFSIATRSYASALIKLSWNPCNWDCRLIYQRKNFF